MEYEWFSLSNAGAKRAPLWAQQAACDSDGVVWLPSVIVGPPMEVFLCASYDGIPALVVGGHAYYPSDWICKAFPQYAEVIERIAAKIRAVKMPSE